MTRLKLQEIFMILAGYLGDVEKNSPHIILRIPTNAEDALQ